MHVSSGRCLPDKTRSSTGAARADWPALRPAVADCAPQTARNGAAQSMPKIRGRARSSVPAAFAAIAQGVSCDNADWQTDR